MKIGFIGLGKLGLPCALAVEDKGHEVIGYDINPKVEEILKTKKLPYLEEGAKELLDKTNIKIKSVKEVVEFAEIIFVAIQTPHNPKYEGITRIPEERVDFDYTFLKNGMKELAENIKIVGNDKIVVIISTVLPGTFDREIRHLLNDKVKICYNPFFIAMGTTIENFLNPEFVLFGVDDINAANKVEEFYKTLHNRPFYRTTIKNAELIKVGYNTFISTKISFINTLMEVCHKTGADIDAVSNAFALADQRLISMKYLYGGMADGGGCHPRDNIALSWLAKKLNLKYDWFENIMMQREKQMEWLIDLIKEQKEKYNLPITILGKSFKKGTNIIVGSPAILLKNILDEYDIETKMYDPHVDDGKIELEKSIFFIATNHDDFNNFEYPAGSIILDPWGYIKDFKNVEVIRIGRNKNK